MQHLHTVKIVGSNPTRSTTFILLPVELALGLRNRVAKVRFLPRVPLYGIVVKWYHTRLLICAMGVRVSPVPPNYDSQVIEFFKSGDIYINNGYLNKVLLLTVVNYHNYHPFYGVCSITGNAQGCEPCRCGIEARHTPQICPISIMDSAVDFYSIDQGSTP